MFNECINLMNVYVYYLNDTNQNTNDWKNTNFNWEIVFNNVKNIG